MTGEKKLSFSQQILIILGIVAGGILVAVIGNNLSPEWGFSIFVAVSLITLVAFSLIGNLGQLFAVIEVVLLCLLICCPPNMRPIYKQDLANYKVHYGLDLKGGSELLYEIDPKEIDPSRSVENVIDETISVISQRIFESQIVIEKDKQKKQVTVREPRIQRQGDNQLLIQLPGLDPIETEMVKRKIQTLGNLEFRLVSSKKTGGDVDEEKSMDEESERKKYERYLKDPKLMESYRKSLLRKGYKWFPARENDKPARMLWVRDGYDFTGKKFQSFYNTTDYSSGQRVIGFELKQEYKSLFEDFTDKYTKEHLAIVFNNKVVAAPQINGKIPGIGIMVGFDAKELQALLDVLKSGSLEIQPELLNEQTIGPSLGEDAIRTGLLAGLIGLSLVILFMLFYYLVPGIVANIALLMNTIILFSVLVIWGETLTLPGIAGIILTMGMAVDANIIIFERIREEKKKWQEMLNPNGQSNLYTRQDMLEILDRGYKQAFSTIFDSNVTTLIIAIVLYSVGSGPVRGFAFTLGWGIVANFITAIFVTRIIFTLLVQGNVVRKMTMLEWVKSPSFGFTRIMGMAVVCSAVLILLGLGLFFVRGERNYGLDLKGGILAHMSLEKPLMSEVVRDRLKDKFTVEVQHIETERGLAVNGWYDFLIRFPNLNQKEIDAIKAKLSVKSEEIRTKNSALKEFNSLIIRYTENYKEAQQRYNHLRREKGDEKEMQAASEDRKRWSENIKDMRQKAERIEKEVDKLKEEQTLLVQEKNHLAGVERLRREIEQSFKDELLPYPFGQIKLGEGRFSTYYVLPVHMQTPIPATLVKETLKNVSEFKSLEIGTKAFEVMVRTSQPVKDPETELPALVKKKLDVVSKLEASQIKAEKGKEENSYRVVVEFNTTTPDFSVQNALEKCEWKEFTLTPIDQGSSKLKAFDLFLILPSEMFAKPIEEIQKIVEERIIGSFEDVNHENQKVYFSTPFPRFEQISGLVAKDQKSKAYQSIFLSLFLILLYIAFRFPNGFIFGLGGIIALAHDVAITLGAIAFFNEIGLVNVEIDLTVIAAILTLVGYSINDTIVVFDRLRENIKKFDKDLWDRFPKSRVSQEYNISLNQTLSRTVFTSLTTILVLIPIFVLNFGKGSALEGFSFSLIIGVIVGTYSSLMIATAFVLLNERKNRTN